MGFASTRPKPKRSPALKHIEAPDRIILEKLQKDDRVSLSDLARKTGLASSSVHYRIKRLEDEGVIKGYRAIVDPVKLGYDILAVSFVRSRYDPRTYERLGKALSRIPGVWAVYFLMGDMDYVVLIRAKNRLDLNRIVYRLISMKDVERSDTRMVMERIKEDTAVPTD
jgi:Lrp/AsnC family leucine-responsive transcriptional regulator